MARRQAPNEVGDSASEAIRAWRSGLASAPSIVPEQAISESELASVPTPPTTETPSASFVNAISKEADRRLAEDGFVAPRGASATEGGQFNPMARSGTQSVLSEPSFEEDEVEDQQDTSFNRVPVSANGLSIEPRDQQIAEQEQLLTGLGTESAGAGPSFQPPTADEFNEFVRDQNPDIPSNKNPSQWGSVGGKSGWEVYFKNNTQDFSRLQSIANRLGIQTAGQTITGLKIKISTFVKDNYKK
jgi:hypothetical protein